MRMHNGENFALGRGNYEYLFAPAKKWLIATPFLRGLSWWGRKMSGQEGHEQSPFKGEGVECKSRKSRDTQSKG